MARIILRKQPRLEAKHKAFVYQAQAVKAIRDLEFAAVFHEQGLGKTKIAIDLMLYWFEKAIVDTVVLVVKKALIRNWQRELAVHTYITPKVLTQNRRANFFVFNSPARVVLTNYEVMLSENDRIRLFCNTRDVGVILDESAKIKNPDTAIAQSLLGLAPLFKRRVIMTGTPVANRPQDIWAQIRFLDQGASLGDDFAGFRRSVDLSNDLSGNEVAQDRYEENLSGIWSRISRFSVRENKRSGVISLPEKTIRTIRTEWEARQNDMYQQVRDTLRAVVIREGVPAEDRADVILKRLLRLVQIASNPVLVDPSYREEPGKLSYLRDIITKVGAQGEKAIIWTSFTENVDWLTKQLIAWNPRRVHGKLAIDARNRAIDQFLGEANVRLLIATPGAAKEGLTLTVANHVVFFDRSFSLDDYLQAQDRIHRISQQRSCLVYNLIMEDSVDEWVDVLLHAKELAAQLAQGDISREFYRSQMSYDFGDILKNMLALK
jgi:SNF2 family DNA or RNA helicase